MRLYRTVLVWLLRLAAIVQIVLGVLTLMPEMTASGGAISGPVAIAPGRPIEHAVAMAIGPLVCLAVAEVLALLLARDARSERQRAVIG